MAQLPNGPFDANQVEPIAPRDPIPPGVYTMHIQKSEMKPTASGNGQFLSLTLEVLDGPCKGRLMWENLNLINPNQIAMDMAYATLSAICRAAGRPNISDSTELHGAPFQAQVEIEPATAKRKAGNSVAKYLPAGGPAGINGTPTAAAPAAAPTTAPAGKPPPWAQTTST